MTGELFDDYLSEETEWFLANAKGADKVGDARALVSRLTQIAEERGVPFRSTVLVLTQWCEDNPRRCPRKRFGQFYVRCFQRQVSTSPRYSAAQPAAEPLTGIFTDWMKDIGEG